MEKVWILLILLVIGVAQAQANTVIEGLVDSCESKYDVFRYRLGVYKANVSELSVAGNEINFAVDLRFLLCQEVEEGVFRRVESDPMREYFFVNPITPERSISVSVKPVEMSVRFLKDGIYKLIDEVFLNGRNANQSFESTINVMDILTENEMDTLLRDGIVQTHFSFFLVKKIVLTTEEYGVMNDIVSYSTHRKTLEFRNSGDGIQVKIVE